MARGDSTEGDQSAFFALRTDHFTGDHWDRPPRTSIAHFAPSAIGGIPLICQPYRGVESRDADRAETTSTHDEYAWRNRKLQIDQEEAIKRKQDHRSLKEQP